MASRSRAGDISYECDTSKAFHFVMRISFEPLPENIFVSLEELLSLERITDQEPTSLDN